MNKKIMILGASILQLPAIQKAMDMGLQVIAVDMNPNAVGFSLPGVIAEVVSTNDIPAVLNAAEKHNIDGVMTLASDMPVKTVAAVAKAFGLCGISEDTALRATNKAYMRSALKKHGVSVPRFYKVSDSVQYVEAVKKFVGSFIVKPVDNSGSRGIVKIDPGASEKQLLEAYEYSRASSRSGDVLVEEYMDGPEVSVETISIDGVCHVIQITDKQTTGSPHFVETGHIQPSRLSDEIKLEIEELAKAANRAIGITNGPSHTEIIVTHNGARIVELGARLGGDCIATHLVPLSTGVDMVECCIKMALGEKPDICAKHRMGAAIRYFKQHAGTITSISGIDTAEKMDGVQQVCIVHGFGEQVTEITDSGARMGFVIAQGADACDAEKICDSALSAIKIKIE